MQTFLSIHIIEKDTLGCLWSQFGVCEGARAYNTCIQTRITCYNYGESWKDKIREHPFETEVNCLLIKYTVDCSMDRLSVQYWDGTKESGIARMVARIWLVLSFLQCNFVPGVWRLERWDSVPLLLTKDWNWFDILLKKKNLVWHVFSRWIWLQKFNRHR